MGNVEWPRLNPNEKELHYMHIAESNKIFMDSNANFGQKDFWNTIDFNENKLNSTFSGYMKKEEL